MSSAEPGMRVTQIMKWIDEEIQDQETALRTEKNCFNRFGQRHTIRTLTAMNEKLSTQALGVLDAGSTAGAEQ
jgi:hypothetical protein